MSFDKTTRNFLAGTVVSCRRRLMEDVTDQLGGVFGMYPDGIVLPLEKLTHLSPDQATAARLLRDLLGHYTSNAEGEEGERHKNAYERMVLEISFTALNRLAALRLCEERGLVVECIRKGSASAGFQVFERISGGSFSSRYESYKTFLECMFDELAVELGVLFDRTTPQSMIFPTERCMEDLLSELNKPELAGLWAEDETIGWIYQYFNPQEERKAMREASQAPRNSRELAVRNQFFTPRYVVEFLTDNTLGRIWYEMRKGDTALKERCRYLVQRPKEIFLAPGEKPPAGGDEETDLSQEELLKRPVYIEHRPKKDPRDLKIIDPACGSGHFLLYVFDLLEEIYEEAWTDPESPKSQLTGRTIQEDFETLEDLRRETPKLIIEYNLHGIDIDPRAVQIAASALWLRAQKSWKNLGLKSFERPGITKSNIVTAEPMPGEEDMRREFTTGLKPRVLGQIVDEIFEKMKLAGEAGSLLKIEEEIKQAVAEAKKQWMKAPGFEQKELFQKPAQYQTKDENRFDLSDVTDESFWERAEDRILDALKDYAEQAENGRTFRRRLFAQDAARGFAFIDLCRKRYDVALMNPPFGLAPKMSFELMKKQYPESFIELYASFVERGRAFTRNGLVGVITSKGFFTMTRLENWRRKNIIQLCQILMDLGLNVMDDAFVRSCAYVISNNSCDYPIIVIDGQKMDSREHSNFSSNFQDTGSPDNTHVYLRTRSHFLKLPHCKFVYKADSMIVGLFDKLNSFEGFGGKVRTGLTTFNDFRFLRLLWEIKPTKIGRFKKWEFFSKGGEYAKYYTDVHLLIKRENQGAELAEVNLLLNGQTAQSRQGASYYYRPGVTFTSRSGKGISVRILPAQCVISHNAPTVYPLESAGLHYLLGWMNSRLARLLIEIQASSDYYTPGSIKILPWQPPSPSQKHEVEQHVSSLLELYRKPSTRDERSPVFCSEESFLGHSPRQGYGTINVSCLQDKAEELQKSISRLIDEVYGLDTSAISFDILGYDPDRDVPLSFPDKKEKNKQTLSYLLGISLNRWDVRITLDPSLAPELPDPFDPLPVCPPGMLVGPDGLPAEPNRIVSEEWLRARPDANTLPPEGLVTKPTITDSEYPLRISWDGILVDDPGLYGAQPHREDIVRRVREVLDLLWKDKAHEIEQEACEILGVSDLRDYFRKPSGFFQDHLKRYSKSRRKAPIYWPLSTASGSYAVWVYYQRLTDQTLYTVVNKFVEPKIDEVERGVGRIENERQSASGREAVRLNELLKEYKSLLSELQDFREELLRIAELPYKPDLNDGVIINAAPFHKLFRLRSWAKDTEACWKKLEKGGYDWSHLAYTIWPDRVRKVCRKDRSIAVAHGLESLFDMQKPKI